MEIDCKQVPEMIAEVFGDEATPELRQALDDHTSACTSCARTESELSLLLARARAVSVPEPPPAYWRSFLPELRRRIERSEARPQGFWPMLVAWLRPAAVIAVTAALVWLVLPAAVITPNGTPDMPGPDDLQDIQRLADAFDRLTPDDPFGIDATNATTFDDALFEVASGDLFSFFDLTIDLSSDEEQELVEALAEESLG